MPGIVYLLCRLQQSRVLVGTARVVPGASGGHQENIRSTSGSYQEMISKLSGKNLGKIWTREFTDWVVYSQTTISSKFQSQRHTPGSKPAYTIPLSRKCMCANRLKNHPLPILFK